MRYYRYGSESKQHGTGINSGGLAVSDDRSITMGMLGQFGELVIDDDTVYEIDEECLQCRKGK